MSRRAMAQHARTLCRRTVRCAAQPARFKDLAPRHQTRCGCWRPVRRWRQGRRAGSGLHNRGVRTRPACGAHCPALDVCGGNYHNRGPRFGQPSSVAQPPCIARATPPTTDVRSITATCTQHRWHRGCVLDLHARRCLMPRHVHLSALANQTRRASPPPMRIWLAVSRRGRQTGQRARPHPNAPHRCRPGRRGVHRAARAAAGSQQRPSAP